MIFLLKYQNNSILNASLESILAFAFVFFHNSEKGGVAVLSRSLHPEEIFKTPV